VCVCARLEVKGKKCGGMVSGVVGPYIHVAGQKPKKKKMMLVDPPGAVFKGT
jgi:hypothetical protein